MTPPLSRRLLLGVGSAAVGAALIPSTARADHDAFGAYGSPRRRLDRRTVYVDRAGRGDHRSPRAALEAAPPGTTVVIAAGEYRERLRVRADQAGITLIGATDDPADVVIVHALAAGMPDPETPEGEPVGAAGSATATIDGEDFTAHGLTLANDFRPADHPELADTQAVAALVRGDRAAFGRCRFIGRRDTLYADSPTATESGRQYYRYCHIEGEADFILGRGTAVFDRCRIHCRERDEDTQGFVFAPSTAAGFEHGFLTVRCRITSSGGVGADKLSHPRIPDADPTAWPALTVRQTWIGPGVDAAAPYADTGEEHPWRDQRYREYANIGPGAKLIDPQTRPPQLGDDEAADHTAAAYLGDWAPYAEPDLDAPRPRAFQVFVAGDSTAADSRIDQKPAAGWGQALPVFTGHRVEVRNRAYSGRSSLSYTAEGWLDDIATELRPGDWLVVSFGHNDQKRDIPDLGTDPWSDYQDYLRTFIEVARFHRAHPILVTSVERRRFDDNGEAYGTLGEYPAGMLALAAEEDVPAIDLNTMSLELWDELGEEATKDYFNWIEPGHPNYPEGNQDNTHFQATGAIAVARLVAKDAAERRLLPRGAWRGLDREVDIEELEWPETTVPPPPV